MYAISIQGHHACRFQLKNHIAQDFRQLIQSVVMNRVVVISGKYRTDVLYYSNKDNQKVVFKLFCSFVGGAVNEETRKRFSFTSTREDTMQRYFKNLLLLERMPAWFLDYKSRFNEVLALEPKHPILADLASSDRYLSENSKTSCRRPLLSNRPVKRSFYRINTEKFVANNLKRYLKN